MVQVKVPRNDEHNRYGEREHLQEWIAQHVALFG